ncbi:nucleoplasmin-2a [Polyodon spathula]|uniref:nucleoplasmin-2a n=1 Tax=Polyodon spathula TaxID=7913 RepID=UPI001B7E5489|nr:nucleoplasmin-2a [Polyodon spathula]
MDGDWLIGRSRHWRLAGPSSTLLRSSSSHPVGKPSLHSGMDPFNFSAISSTQEDPVCVLWGCELTGGARKFVFEVQNDLLEHQLFIKTICLGAEAKDELHVVEVEAKITHNDRPVPIASLRPSVLPMVSFYGLELVPPVTFNLRSGEGPVYISGQHLVLDLDVGEEAEEEERPVNSSLC